MDNYIKTQLREGLLKENFATAKELKQLADDALRHWCKIWEKNREVNINHEVYSVHFYEKGKYDTLDRFLYNTSIKFEFAPKLKSLGVCKSLNQFEHEITLRLTEKEIEDLQDDLDYYIGDAETSFDSFVYWATNKYQRVLIHELQHAYDGWRSKMNFGQKQRDPSYQEKYKKANIAKDKDRNDWTDKDMKDVLTHQRAYMRLDHEISARFVDTLSELSVWTVKRVDGRRQKVVKPWKEYFYDFKTQFMGWEEVTTAQKKSLKRKLAKAYYDGIEDFKEWLKNRN
jgi:hypothetical protein